VAELTSTQRDLLPPLSIVQLVDAGVPIVAPPGIVYSTAPRSRRGADGHLYVTKGIDVGTLAAETLGYCLAQPLGIRVPEFALGEDAAGLWFASRKLDRALRDPSPFIPKRRTAISHLVVLDVWLCNSDRNMGGILIEEHDSEDIVAIDFEKSHVAREPYPLTMVPTVPPHKLWPTGELGKAMQGVQIPRAFLQTVCDMSNEMIDGIVGTIAQTLPLWTWAESTRIVLRNRRDSLRKLIVEVWK
jgi:hypothetical protein